MQSYLDIFLKTPKGQMILALLLILISNLFWQFDIQVIISFLIIVISCLIFDFLFWKLRGVSPFFPSAALVTGLIITLLLSPSYPLYILILTSAIAMFFKNFLSFGGRHIFNPASIGLFLVGIFLQENISWWGVSFQSFNLEIDSVIFFLILLSPLFISVIKMKRYKIILPFLITYGLILLISRGDGINLDNIKLSFLDPTVLFFSLVMLPEPRTSPNIPKFQLAFGIFVAVLAFILSQPFFRSFDFLLIPDPFITALLVGNLLFFRK